MRENPYQSPREPGISEAEQLINNKKAMNRRKVMKIGLISTAFGIASYVPLHVKNEKGFGLVVGSSVMFAMLYLQAIPFLNRDDRKENE